MNGIFRRDTITVLSRRVRYSEIIQQISYYKFSISSGGGYLFAATHDCEFDQRRRRPLPMNDSMAARAKGFQILFTFVRSHSADIRPMALSNKLSLVEPTVCGKAHHPPCVPHSAMAVLWADFAPRALNWPSSRYTAPPVLSRKHETRLLHAMSGPWGRPHPDVLAAKLTIPAGPLSVRNALPMIVAALPSGWLATLFVSYVIRYKKTRTYTHGAVG
jgi:hypothetical protein